MLRRFMFLFALAASPLWIGCESPSTPSKPTPESGKAANGDSAETPRGAADSDVSLDIKSWNETLELVAQHKGKVVVLDLWSTSCDPCIREFPNLVNLSRQHSSDKLVCMSASCDYEGRKDKPPESYRPRVLELLQKQGAKFSNVLLNVEIDVLLDTIDLASIPAVYVFGPDGQVAKRFDNDLLQGGEFTYEKDVVPFVDQLLKGPKDEDRGTSDKE